MAAILAACSDDATTSAPTTTDAGVDAAADGTDAGTFTVGGNVTGLLGTGLVVQNNAGDDLAIAADGAFTFSTAAVSAATYAVTVKTQPTGPEQTCVVANGSGAIAEASVTNVSVTCGTNAYPVSVSATGLAGTLVLQDNNGDDLTLIADGTYAFASHVAAGNAYAVTVKTRPLNQICTITQATTTSSRTNTVAVSCVSRHRRSRRAAPSPRSGARRAAPGPARSMAARAAWAGFASRRRRRRAPPAVRSLRR